MNRHLLLILILLGLPTLGLAQTAFRTENIGYYQGLPSETVFGTTLDSKGFLYVSTPRGIAVYDGYRFLASDSIRHDVSSFTYHKGKFYFHDNKHGLAWISAITDEPTTIKANRYNDSNPNNDHFENLFVDSQQRIWCHDFKSLKCVVANEVAYSFDLYSKNNPEHKVFFTEPFPGTIWAFTREGLYVYEGKNFRRSSHSQLAHTAFTAARRIGARQICFATTTGQIGCIDLKTQKITWLPKLPDAAQPLGFSEMGTGKWLVYSAHLVAVTNATAGGYEVLYQSETNINHVQADAFTKLIWIATGKGLVKLAPIADMATYKFPLQATRNFANHVVQDAKGTLWSSDENGRLWRFAIDQWQAESLPFNVNGVFYAQKQLFVTSGPKVYWRQNNGFIPLELGTLPNAEIRKVLLSRDQELWLLYQNRAPMRFAWPSLQPIAEAYQNPPGLWTENTWNDIFENSDGKVWLGGWAPKSYGMIYFDRAQNRFIDNSDLKSNAGKTMYFGDYVNRIATLDHGRMLFSGYGGFNYVEADGRVSKLVDVNSYPIANGRTEGIAQTKTGSIVFATADGLQVYLPKKDRVLRISRADGLAADELLYGFTLLQDGRIAIGIDNGVTLVDVDKFLEPKQKQRLVLSSMLVNGQIRSFSGLEVKLAEDEQDVSLLFSDLSYRERSKVFYRYKFSDDGNWHLLGNSPELTLNHMTPGQYDIEIQAGNSLDHWQPQSLKIHIDLKPPFYRSAGFLILLGILVALGILLFNRRILARQRREAQYMQRIRESQMQTLRAQMNPHFMFNTLNSINSFIIENRSEEASAYLTTFSKLMRSILEFSKQEAITLREEMQGLKLYLELEAARLEHGFDYTFEMERELRQDDTVKVPPLILQPFVENAIWHGLQHKATPGHLYVRITHDQDMLYIVIEDDGIGREAAGQLKKKQVSHKSYGIDITRERIRMLAPENSVVVEDLLNNDGSAAGTAVHIGLKR